MLNPERLIGKHLKSKLVIEMLNWLNFDVVYEFDRSNGGMDDCYWAGTKESGILFKFNQNQILETVFIHLSGSRDYDDVDRSLLDTRIYESVEEAENHFSQSKCTFKSGSASEGKNQWVNVFSENTKINYLFVGGQACKITVSLTSKTCVTPATQPPQI